MEEKKSGYPSYKDPMHDKFGGDFNAILVNEVSEAMLLISVLKNELTEVKAELQVMKR